MEIFQKNNVIICIGNISEWRKKRMVDFRIEKLANNLLTYSVNIQKGDKIYSLGYCKYSKTRIWWRRNLV